MPYTSHQLTTVEAALPMRHEPLCYLTPAEQEMLRAQCTITTMPRNNRVYVEGERADKMFLIVRGKVKTTMEGVGGRQYILKLATDMDFIGYRAMLSGERHTATAVTVDETTIITVPKSVTMELVNKNPLFASYVIKMLAMELRVVRHRSISLLTKQVRGRLADSLLFLKKKYGYASGTQRININLSREELAALSNMTTANAIRTLSAFADEGVVGVDGRNITICSEEELEKISKMG